MFQGRLIAVLSALALALTTACGSSEEEPASSGGGEDAQKRSIEHAMGSTEITGTPKRIVALDTGELDSAIALGVKPVGAVTAATGAGYPSYLEGQTEGITEVGTIAEPSLEKIASLRPDLIISSKLRHEAIYPQLSKIAPTVFAEEVGVTWKENLKLFAEAMNKTAEGDQLFADYDEATQKFQDGIGDRLADMEVSVVRSLADEVRIMGKASFIGTVLEDAGVQRPKAQAGDFFMKPGTPENIGTMDGDVLFLSKFGDDHERLESLQERPAWSLLRAVKNDRVTEVEDDYWMLGIGILAAQKVVADLEGLLAEEQ